MTASNANEALGFDRARLERIQSWMQRYVDDGLLPFAATVVTRHGQIAWQGYTGYRNVAAALPYQPDTIVRMYSMTKPVTAVALMMLYEQGLFHLDDPIEVFLPEFTNVRVLRSDARAVDDIRLNHTKPTIHHLLTHTAGLSYGFQGGLLGQAYKDMDVDFNPGGDGLAATVQRLSQLPLQFEPGTQWHYSVSFDVLGRLIEVISGLSLDRYFDDHIFAPLGMDDTSFAVPDGKQDRLANLYSVDGHGGMKLDENAEASAFQAGRVTTLSGGGGLLSTASDYLVFSELLRASGELSGIRLLSPRTVKFMASNHLDGDLASMGPKTWCETSFSGVGFGLGMWVLLDPPKAQMLGSPDDYGWGGMASTVFWVDPVEDMTVLFLTQLMPSSFYPLRKELRALVYQALTD